jgi:hypothetical protein
MCAESQPGERREAIDARRDSVGSRPEDSSQDRKYRIALVLYAALGALAWFTIGEGKVFIGGRPVELRLLPLVVLGGFALRTVLAHHAEKIRRSGSGGGS